jgi:small subunit ribosomal protein S17
MPRRVEVGVVVGDKASKTRRVEIPRLVKDPRYKKYVRRRTVCHVHDEAEESRMGDLVEIVESRPRSRLKRWELVRVVEKSRAVDLAEIRARIRRHAAEAAAEAEAGGQPAAASPEDAQADRPAPEEAGAEAPTAAPDE